MDVVCDLGGDARAISTEMTGRYRLRSTMLRQPQTVKADEEGFEMARAMSQARLAHRSSLTSESP